MSAAETPPQIGLEMHEAHFPSRAAVEAYGDGGFRFAGMSHQGSILCLPSGIYGWNVDTAETFSNQYFARVEQEATVIEVLLVGTGSDIVPLSQEMRQFFRDLSIICEPMSTGAAVRTFNVLLSEERAVAAALIAVER